VDVHNLSSRAGAAVVVSSLLLCTSLATADAASSAQVASAPTTVTSGTWGAVATTNTTAPFGTGPLALTFTLGGPSRQYFNAVNAGTLPLIAESFKITTTAGSAIIEACSTTWTESNGRCPSGVITTVTTSGAGYTSFSAPLPAAGSSIRLRARVTGLQLLDSTVTINVEVTRAQARAAATTGN
jgi:hypothetical protein